ncbi:hypothetical protein AKJ16_DCAP26842 [Drosera capensis]
MAYRRGEGQGQGQGGSLEIDRTGRVDSYTQQNVFPNSHPQKHLIPNKRLLFVSAFKSSKMGNE